MSVVGRGESINDSKKKEKKMRKESKKFTLRNRFHNTEVNVVLKKDGRGNYPLSESQIKRVRKTLCGCTYCSCGVVRGPQQWGLEYDFDNVDWTFYPKWTVKKGRDEYDEETDMWFENWYVVDEDGYQRGGSYTDEESALFAIKNLD
jgi:hypothetical protein